MLEFAEPGNIQMERRWQNPLCSIQLYPDYGQSEQKMTQNVLNTDQLTF